MLEKAIFEFFFCFVRKKGVRAHTHAHIDTHTHTHTSAHTHAASLQPENTAPEKKKDREG